MYVNLYKNGKPRHYSIHRLVAEAFIPNPQGKPEVNHDDGNKENCCVSNLYWATKSENMQHAFKTGLSEKTRRVAKERCSELGKTYGKINGKNNAKPVNQYDLNGNFIRTWESAREAERQLKIGHHIIECCKSKLKTAYGYIWRYKDTQ